MATNTNIQITRQDPKIEAYRVGLLKDVQKFIKNQIGEGMPAETGYKVAGMTDPEKAAIQAASGGIGAYQPFLQSGEAAIQGGQNVLTGSALPGMDQARATMGSSQDIINRAMQLQGAQQGVPGTYQQAAAQTVAGIGAFNPYQEQVIDQSMRDIARQSGLEQQRIRSNAVGSGSFGGSRQAVAEQELFRNSLDQMGRTAGQLRQAGYDAAMARRLSEAKLMGDLGVTYGQLAQGDVSTLGALAGTQQALGEGLGSLSSSQGQLGATLGQLGVQQAGIGELGQSLTNQQLSNAMSAGAAQRGFDQSVLDATRLSNIQAQQYPYQQYGFLSDIYAGVPTSQSTITASSAPQTSPFQSAIGLGISGLSAAAGAAKAGLF